MPTLVEHAIDEERAIKESGPLSRAEGWLNPARGIAIGIAIGLTAWTIIGTLAWILMR